MIFGCLKSSILSFPFPYLGFIFQKSGFCHTVLGLLLFFLCFFRVLSSTYCDVFCHRFVMTCFTIDWLQRIVVSLTVNFFMGFYIGSLDESRSLVCCRS